MRLSFCLLLAIVVARGASAQSGFSADIVNLSHPDNPYQTKIYASANKLRFEGHDKQGHMGSVMIVDLTTRHSFVLMPQQKMYAEQIRPQIPGQGVAFFRAKDVQNACMEWQRIAPDDSKDCHKLAEETTNGRPTVKYEGKTEKGESVSLWLDVKLRFPVKWEARLRAGELRNIEEGAQPASLFSIPTGFKKRVSGIQTTGPKDDDD